MVVKNQAIGVADEYDEEYDSVSVALLHSRSSLIKCQEREMGWNYRVSFYCTHCALNNKLIHGI